MAVQHVWLQIEEIPNYNPIFEQPVTGVGRDCMRTSGHDDGSISAEERNSRYLTALVYREYTDKTYTIRVLEKLIKKDVNEADGVLDERIGTVIYTTPETTLKIHVQNVTDEPHSFHVHGISYGIDSDGSWPFGTQSKIGDAIRRSDEICSGEMWTYTYDVTEDMIGVWPFHDHYRMIGESIGRGLFGAIVVAPSLEEIPQKVIFPESVAGVYDNPGDAPLSVKKNIIPYLQEVAERTDQGAQLGPDEVIHVPIFFHVLGESRIPVFDKPVGSGGSTSVDFNETSAKDYYYHCSIHPGMFGVIHVAPGGASSKTVEIRDNPVMSFYDDGSPVALDGTVTWQNNSRYAHTVTEGSAASVCINGRTFVGNTPTVEVGEGQQIRWYVCNLDLGMNWHNFHTHGLRFRMPILKFSIITQNNDIAREDIRSIGPAESFVLETIAPNILPAEYVPPQDPTGRTLYNIKGEFLFHCHVEMHMMTGLAGLMRVKGQIWLTDEEKRFIEENIGFPEDNGTNNCPEIQIGRCEAHENGIWDFVEGDPLITMMHAILIPKTNKFLIRGYTGGANQLESRIFNLDEALIGNDPFTTPSKQPSDKIPGGLGDKIQFSNLWSSAHTYLDTDEGKILIHGGFTGYLQSQYENRQTFIFDPTNLDDPWVFLGVANQTQDGRFYATTITIHDGKVLTLLGDHNPNEPSYSIELFDPVAGNWLPKIPLDGSQPYRYYPWTYELQDGTLFVAGPQKETRKFDYVGGNQFVEYPGAKGDRDGSQQGTSALFPQRPSSIPSENYSFKVLIAGGQNATTQDSVQSIDLSSDRPAWTEILPGLAYPRKYQTNSVMLMNGRIMICGGAVNPLNPSQRVAGRCETFDPETQSLKTMAQNLSIRGYHSAALLMPDGSVIMGGDLGMSFYDGTHVRFERYRPPYFFQVRPRILDTWVPPLVHYTDLFLDIPLQPGITTSDEIKEVALIRPGAVTHGWNMTQKFIGLKMVDPPPDPSTVRVILPPDGYIAPPGWYLLVVIKGGVCGGIEECGNLPSEAVWVRLTQ